MLKNSVPSDEYVIMTNPVFKNFVDFYGLDPERRTEVFEGSQTVFKGKTILGLEGCSLHVCGPVWIWAAQG